MSEVLQRLSTRYVPEQDRLCMTGLLASGQTVQLWLTQRLLLRLVPTLTAWLEQQPGAQSSVVQEFVQQAAQAQLAPQPAVVAQADVAEALVLTVRVGRAAEAVTLHFDAAPLATSCLVLNTQQLRQWLSIVLAACQAAQWPLDGWPLWLRQPAGAALPARDQWH